MIDFSANYPDFLENTTGSELCGIPALSLISFGSFDMDATVSMYNSYAQELADSLISGDIVATDRTEQTIDGNIAANEFVNAHASIIRYVNTKVSIQKRIMASDGIQLPSLTTAQRDALTLDYGIQILNTDTGNTEIYTVSGWKDNKGPQGSIGTQGSAGSNGAQGDIGPQGNAGSNGAQGDIGPQGSAGSNGAQGDIGPQGSAGSNGAQGDIGPQGNAGTQGVHAGLSYQYTYTTSTVTTEPTSGIIAFDATDLSTVTMMYMNAISADLVDTSGLAAMLSVLTNPLKGSFRISSTSDTSQYAYFSIVNPNMTLTGSGYVYDTETEYLGGNVTSFSDTTALVVTFTLRGAEGAQGTQGDNGAVGTQGAQGDIGPQGATGSGTQGPQGNTGTAGAQGDIGPQGATGSGTQGPQGDTGPQGPQVDTSGLVANVSGAQQVTAIEVVTALPGTQSSSTLYFILE